MFLAVSQTNDPRPIYVYDLTNVGGFPDFSKPGYNKDAIFISYNDFGSTGGYAAVAVIDKAAALTGTLVYYTSYPPPQFRAIPPARMGDDLTGGTEWFMSIIDGGGNTVRVTKMTNYLSNSPHYTTWELPVIPFGFFIANADQPGGTRHCHRQRPDGDCSPYPQPPIGDGHVGLHRGGWVPIPRDTITKSTCTVHAETMTRGLD